jgi:hypothetical protein
MVAMLLYSHNEGKLMQTTGVSSHWFDMMFMVISFFATNRLA